jgi:hypothetical protein
VQKCYLEKHRNKYDQTRRSQKHYPAPLAIPLPNYSYDQAGKEMLERQASQRFGTIPRVSAIMSSQQDRARAPAAPPPRSCHLDSSEDDAYHAKTSLNTRSAQSVRSTFLD